MLTVNGTEVQKHQLMAPVGYTIVGNPTIVDGIASGFANDDYLATDAELTNTENAISQEDLELYCKCTVGTLGPYQCLLKYQTYVTPLSAEGAAQGISGLIITGGNKFVYKVSTAPADQSVAFQAISSVTPEAGRTYILRGYFTGDNTYAISVSSDNGETWVTDTVTKTYSPDRLSINKPCSIGQADRTGSCQYPFKGSIDLNETYIKVNGKLWFWQPAPTKYIVKDGKLVFADTDIYLQSSGTQMINTGIDAYSRWELIAQSTQSDSRSKVLIGRSGSGPTWFGSSSSGGWVYWGSGTAVTTVPASTKANIDITFTGNGVSGTVNGSIFNRVEATTNTNNFSIFNSTVGGNWFIGKIWVAKCYDSNNTLVRHFVPVPAGLVIGNYTVPSNGMFDIVNQQFYANQGTGEFTIGRDE